MPRFEKQPIISSEKKDNVVETFTPEDSHEFVEQSMETTSLSVAERLKSLGIDSMAMTGGTIAGLGFLDSMIGIGQSLTVGGVDIHSVIGASALMFAGAALKQIANNARERLASNKNE